MKTRTLALLLAIAFASLPRAALAQEELIEDMHVVKNCVGESAAALSGCCTG